MGFSLGPTAGGGAFSAGGVALWKSELLAACVVCGPRRTYARPFEPAGIAEAATLIGEALARRRWRRWAQLLLGDGRTAATLAELPIAEAAGLSLDAFRVFGPLAAPLLQDTERHRDWASDPRVLSDHDLDVLVASSGPHWRMLPRVP